MRNGSINYWSNRQGSPMPNKPPPEPNLEVVWEPIKGSSQELAIDTRCHHTLYHGTRGPGKTITQLMRFRRRVGIGYGSFWRGVIFDKEYKNFADIIAQSKRFFSKFDDGAKFISSPSDLKWVGPQARNCYSGTLKNCQIMMGFTVGKSHFWDGTNYRSTQRPNCMTN